MKTVAILIAMLALAGCAATTPHREAAPARGGLELGAYQRAPAANVTRSFAREVSEHYRVGADASAAAASLRRDGFACAPGPRGGRGAPPNRICSKSVREGECAHTWQVLLYEHADKLTEARGRYDRACRAEDGLLGGN